MHTYSFRSTFQCTNTVLCKGDTTPKPQDSVDKPTKPADTEGKESKTTKAPTSTDPVTMVLIGDSMSDYAKQTADKYCNNIKSTNKGIGGSTAEQVGGQLAIITDSDPTNFTLFLTAIINHC